MEFISTEEFLKQSIEVQKVFIDWWKPSIGDLFVWNDDENYNDMHEVNCCSSKNMVDMTTKNKGVKTERRIPLLTEGQLRKFIEDSTGFKVRLEPYQNDAGIKGVQINLVRGICLSCGISRPYYEEQIHKCFDALDINVIKAYWQVAIKIAEEISEM